MKGECWVTPKQKFRCVYVTKDNVEEFVNLFGISEEHTFEYKDNMAIVHYPKMKMKWYIYLDSYYVDDFEYYVDDLDDFEGWTHYSKEQFEKKYELYN